MKDDYQRTSPWSINANERAYSIDPWSFQSATIRILDLRLETRGPNKWGWDNDEVAQITGNAKFPDFGFVGQEAYSNALAKMGEYVIFPIDHEAIEKEFQEGLHHYKAALGRFRDEFDQLSHIEISEKFGDPHKYGVCRITTQTYGDNFFRIYVGRDFFDQLSSAILRVGVSEINIRFRLWNAYENEKLYPFYIGGEVHSSRRLFLTKSSQSGLIGYVSHGIIDDINVDYSYNKIVTNSGYNYENDQTKSLIQSIDILRQNSVLVNEKLSKIFNSVIFIFIFILIISLAFAIWR